MSSNVILVEIVLSMITDCSGGGKKRVWNQKFSKMCTNKNLRGGKVLGA